MIAEAAAQIGRLAADSECHPGERKGDEITEHMAGIGKQCERSGQHTADRLDRHEAAGNQQRAEQSTFAVGVVRGVCVNMIVIVAHHALGPDNAPRNNPVRNRSISACERPRNFICAIMWAEPMTR